MTFIVLVPVCYNDGVRVPESLMNRFVREAYRRFGGCSRREPVVGHWIDPDDGRHYHDESVELSVVCQSERIVEAMRFARSIGRRLRQKAIYFEVHDFGVCFLRP